MKRWISAVSLSLVLAMMTGAAALSNDKLKMESAFSSYERNDQLPLNIPRDQPIVEYSGIKITTDEFHQYRTNVKLMDRYHETEHLRSNEQMIEAMIKQQLVLQYAKKKGIVVSDQEVRQYMDQQRNILEQAPQEVQEFRDHVIKAKRLTKELYWSSPELIEDYRNWMLHDKLAEHLADTGEIENIFSFGDFGEKLWQQHKSNVTINHQLLNKFN